MKKNITLLIAGIFLLMPISGKTELDAKKQQVIEKQAMVIYENIRCVICEGQSIKDSNAELAKDLRNIIKEKLKIGMDKERIYEFLANSYGDKILMKPPLKPKNYLLWFGPIIFIIIGIVILIRIFANSTSVHNG